MRKKILLKKKVGETPLEAIETWKSRHPRYKDVPASYAGRLDPMASGKLLILLGDECKKQKDYTGLDKTYTVEILLDVASDTGDILGIVTPSDYISRVDKETIRDVLKAELGTHARPYPVYSSKTVAGKPLFLYALEGTLPTIEIPVHNETIYSIRYRGTYSLSRDRLQKRIASLLAKAPTSDMPSKTLGADFRIAEVKKSWGTVFEQERRYRVLRLTVSCGSGTYMRSLACRIGQALGTQALALSIHRIRIGR